MDTKDLPVQPDDVMYYYLRRESHPVACIALLPHEDQTVSRGIALCSPEDQFRRSTGRKLAFARLCKAVGSCINSGRIKSLLRRSQDHPALQAERCGLYYKSYYRAAPSEFEKRMIKIP